MLEAVKVTVSSIKPKNQLFKIEEGKLDPNRQIYNVYVLHAPNNNLQQLPWRNMRHLIN